MIHLQRALRILTAVSLAAAISLHAAEPAPLGHRDFYPSPQRPVGFRGDGSACYPGATPVIEFWDGTPAEVERPLMKESFGKPIDNRGRTTAKVWDVTDGKSKNIVWKTPLPGWSLAEPTVVGDRVFAVGEPDWLTCLDARTGKVLWQKRVLPLRLDGRSHEEAERLQEIIDLAVVFWILKGQAGASMFLRLPPGQCAPIAAKLVERLPAWRKTVESADQDPKLLEAFDKGAAAIAARAKPNAEWDIADMKEVAEGLRAFVKAVENKYKVPVASEWYGNVGNATSTPASDGERVYVAYGQGQVAAYDLNGNMCWGVRFKEWEHGKRGMINLGPRLCEGVVIVKSPSGKRRGLEAKTGRILWEHDPAKKDYYHVCQVVSLKGANGTSVRAVVHPGDLTVRRATDDRILGQIPLIASGKDAGEEGGGSGGHVLTRGDLVWRGKFPNVGAVFRLSLRDAEHVEAAKVRDTGFKVGWPLHTATPDCFIAPSTSGSRNLRCLYDFATGQALGSFSAPDAGGDGGPHCWTMGDKLIVNSTANHGNNAWWRGPMSYGGGQGGQGRPTDRKAMVRLGVVDISDPKAPKTVADRNLLQEEGPPADIFIEKYLHGIDPFLFAGCYLGSASYFGCYMGGPVPSGNRLFIQSVRHLRCIGDPKAPYDWNPASRPEKIASTPSAPAKGERKYMQRRKGQFSVAQEFPPTTPARSRAER